MGPQRVVGPEGLRLLNGSACIARSSDVETLIMWEVTGVQGPCRLFSFGITRGQSIGAGREAIDPKLIALQTLRYCYRERKMSV